MTNLNVSINEELLAYIKSRVSDGAYVSVSDYLQALVAADRQRTEITDQLLMESLESGDPVPLNMAEIRRKALSAFDQERAR
jgi:Arc/MetJ-type ribon-helix-helix transcriptional regulator